MSQFLFSWFVGWVICVVLGLIILLLAAVVYYAFTASFILGMIAVVVAVSGIIAFFAAVGEELP